MGSRQDSSSAFMNDETMYHDIDRSAKDLGIRTLLFENAENEPAPLLCERLLKMAPQKAKFLWINQHGPDKEEEQVLKRWEYILGIGSDRSSLVLKEDGAIACLMCSGGKEGNLMEHLAKKTLATITGPTRRTTRVSNIIFTIEEGKLKINAEYGFLGPESVDGKTAIYSSSHAEK